MSGKLYHVTKEANFIRRFKITQLRQIARAYNLQPKSFSIKSDLEQAIEEAISLGNLTYQDIWKVIL